MQGIFFLFMTSLEGGAIEQDIIQVTVSVSHQVCHFFFISSVCLLVRVTMVNKNKAVVCCLLATSAIMLSETKKRKRKMWSKKQYLKGTYHAMIIC